MLAMSLIPWRQGFSLVWALPVVIPLPHCMCPSLQIVPAGISQNQKKFYFVHLFSLPPICVETLDAQGSSAQSLVWQN